MNDGHQDSSFGSANNAFVIAANGVFADDAAHSLHSENAELGIAEAFIVLQPGLEPRAENSDAVGAAVSDLVAGDGHHPAIGAGDQHAFALRPGDRRARF